MTAPRYDPDYKRLDAKVTALLVITGITLLILIAALLGWLDLVT
jgi:hypothetical protein